MASPLDLPVGGKTYNFTDQLLEFSEERLNRCFGQQRFPVRLPRTHFSHQSFLHTNRPVTGIQLTVRAIEIALFSSTEIGGF